MDLLGFSISRTAKQNRRQSRRAETESRANPLVASGWYGDTSLEENPLLKVPYIWKTYRRARRGVPIISAFVELFLALASQVNLSFLMRGTDEPDDRAAELLGALLEPTQLRSLAEGYLYGLSVLEWQADANLRIHQAWSLPMSTVVKVRVVDNVVVGFTQFLEDGRMIELPAWKSAFTVKDRPPYGEGILMNVMDQALKFLRNSDLVAAAGEFNLKNLPNWSWPADTKDTDPAVKAITEQLTQPEGAFTKHPIPPSEVQRGVAGDSGVRFIQRPKWDRTYPPRAALEANQIMDKMSQQIATALGVHHLLLGDTGMGSYALAKAQGIAFTEHVTGGVRLITESLQRVVDLLYPWLGYGEPPIVKADYSDTTSPLELAQVIKTLYDAGEPPENLEPARREALSLAGLPLVEPEDEVPSGEGNEPDDDNEPQGDE